LGRFIVHMHAWPLFITIAPPTVELADVEAYILEVEAVYKRRERFATLFDSSPILGLPGAHVRRRLAEWQNDTIDAIKRYNVFTATVIKSPVVRGAMTAMNWVFRPPNEQIVVPSFSEGFVRCIDKLRAAGYPAPPDLDLLAHEAPPTRVEDTLPAAKSARFNRTITQRGRARGA
jgi:hypothetical protein